MSWFSSCGKLGEVIVFFNRAVLYFLWRIIVTVPLVFRILRCNRNLLVGSHRKACLYDSLDSFGHRYSIVLSAGNGMPVEEGTLFRLILKASGLYITDSVILSSFSGLTC